MGIQQSRNVKLEEEKMFMEQHEINGPSSSSNQSYSETKLLTSHSAKFIQH